MTALKLNTFWRKLKTSSAPKILKQIFIGYKQAIQKYVDYNELIDFMLKGKSLLDYTNLYFSNKYEKNDKIIVKKFQ